LKPRRSPGRGEARAQCPGGEPRGEMLNRP
jgi:hypothetical protein